MGTSFKTFALFGGTGTIGTALTEAALNLGHKVISFLRVRELPSELQNHPNATIVRGVNIADPQSVANALTPYKDKIDVLWKLAAPLSVDTQNDPAFSEKVTVGGTQSILDTLASFNRKPVVCFSDSIGSFGKDSPRKNANVQWLIDNPTQDPGSEYGIQKRAIRDMLVAAENIDTRFFIIPGVLHLSPVWGDGTTEYALDAIKDIIATKAFECPIPPDAELPMIYLNDLVDAMVRLSVADSVKGAQGGFSLQGFSFTPEQLRKELQEQLGHDSFHWEYSSEHTDSQKPEDIAKACKTRREIMTRFAASWPETVDCEAIANELGWAAKHDFKSTISAIIAARKSEA